jgi:hypothetical protein
MLKAAHSAWDRGHREVAGDKLNAALALAHNLHYF